jgi:hypothetical protein
VIPGVLHQVAGQQGDDHFLARHGAPISLVSRRSRVPSDFRRCGQVSRGTLALEVSRCPPRSAANEVPARRSRQISLIELIHPVHAGEAEHLRWDDPEDRVRRRAGSWGVLTIDLVPLGLERPAAGAEDLSDVSNGVVLGERIGAPDSSKGTGLRNVTWWLLTSRAGWVIARASSSRSIPAARCAGSRSSDRARTHCRPSVRNVRGAVAPSRYLMPTTMESGPTSGLT